MLFEEKTARLVFISVDALFVFVDGPTEKPLSAFEYSNLVVLVESEILDRVVSLSFPEVWKDLPYE